MYKTILTWDEQFGSERERWETFGIKSRVWPLLLQPNAKREERKETKSDLLDDVKRFIAAKIHFWEKNKRK